MARNNEPEVDIDDIDDNEPDAPRQLREYAKRQAQKAKLADQLQKENAALRAGVDTSTRLGQAWLADYKGPLDDAAAMLADAKDFSPLIVRGESATATSETAATATETTAQSGETTAQMTTETNPSGSAERNALANGAVASGAAQEDVRASAMRLAREALEKGAGENEAAGGAIAALARGAMAGQIEVLDSSGQRRVL